MLSATPILLNIIYYNTMGYQAFDQYASEYDAWFLENTNVLETELRLVASCLKNSGRILSIGCGSGLFEKLLADRYGIRITHGIEPAEGMAAIARKRGFDVEINTAEEADYGTECYDTVLFNGCPCYMQDLGAALRKAMQALTPGGKVVVIDVPKESPYGLIYNLALAVGTWDHPLLEGCKPKDPYPIELVKQAAWRTTKEKSDIIKSCGYVNLQYSQTLTLDPHYSYTAIEDPIEGYDRGSYVAICAQKPAAVCGKKWSERAWEAVQGIMEDIHRHPFLQEMAAGTLPSEKFVTYLEQDKIYIKNYAEEMLALAKMLPQSRLQSLFEEFAREGIAAEEALHKSLSEQFGRPEGVVTPLEGTSEYMSHTRQFFEKPDLALAMAAMLPCMWVYNEVGKYIISIEKGGESNPYHDWISCYSSPLMDEGVENSILLADEVAAAQSPERQALMLEAFVRAARLEWIFWNQAY